MGRSRVDKIDMSAEFCRWHCNRVFLWSLDWNHTWSKHRILRTGLLLVWHLE